MLGAFEQGFIVPDKRVAKANGIENLLEKCVQVIGYLGN